MTELHVAAGTNFTTAAAAPASSSDVPCCCHCCWWCLAAFVTAPHTPLLTSSASSPTGFSIPSSLSSNILRSATRASLTPRQPPQCVTSFILAVIEQELSSVLGGLRARKTRREVRIVPGSNVRIRLNNFPERGVERSDEGVYKRLLTNKDLHPRRRRLHLSIIVDLA
ncbi:hypothetical protein Hamer_G023877 [Homarus americanus]|uniref:Uncharacterized protein n=1 Tax=Homarus americanus TaxID=6706 RepID=A0A8J5N0I3_HOMAM|nr:hypothetical protein Hamer_G023877 [Homarus americanus]